MALCYFINIYFLVNFFRNTCYAIFVLRRTKTTLEISDESLDKVSGGGVHYSKDDKGYKSITFTGEDVNMVMEALDEGKRNHPNKPKNKKSSAFKDYAYWHKGALKNIKCLFVLTLQLIYHKL